MKKLGIGLCAIALAGTGMGTGCGAEPYDISESEPEATAVSVDAIIGGVPATAYPEAVVINMDATASSYYACSAVLIAPRVVLTAGHCVDEHKRFELHAGKEYRLSTSAVTYDWAEHGAQTVNPQHHDIGLVFLDQPVMLQSYPTLAKAPVADKTTVVNVGRVKNGTLTGDLYMANAVVKAGASVGFPFDYTSVDVIQSGDSGGPVMVAGSHVVAAVNSGAGNGIQVLARVDLLYSWIQTQIAAHPVTSADAGAAKTDAGVLTADAAKTDVVPTTDGAARSDAVDARVPEASTDAGAKDAAGTTTPEAGTSTCAAEKESNDTVVTANVVKDTLCGSLGTATDLDWLKFTATPGTFGVRVTSAADAALQIGFISGSTCTVAATGQAFSVTVAGGNKDLCLRVSSSSKRVQTYQVTVSR